MHSPLSIGIQEQIEIELLETNFDLLPTTKNNDIVY